MAKPLLLYTLGRIVIFGVLLGILWLVGTDGVIAVLAALVLSIPVSYFALRRQREQLTAGLQQRMQRRRDERETLRSRLRGDRR